MLCVERSGCDKLAKNMVCGVRWGCLNFALTCFARRQIRLALLVCLCVFDGGVVVELTGVECGCAKECGVLGVVRCILPEEGGINNVKQ